MSGGVGVQSDMSLFQNREKDVHVPKISAKMSTVDAATFAAENYRVRIQRFVINGESMSDIAMLENLWTIGMDPKDDRIYILTNKEFTFNDEMIVIVTFMEHKTKVAHWRLPASDSPPAQPVERM